MGGAARKVDTHQKATRLLNNTYVVDKLSHSRSNDLPPPAKFKQLKKRNKQNEGIITNNGWTATYPTIAIQGPIRNPIVGNFTTGQFIALSGTYASTDVINIDLDQKLITLNGASARNLLTGNSQWFAADPGVSEFYLSGTNTVSGQTAATVSYRSAYI